MHPTPQAAPPATSPGLTQAEHRTLRSIGQPATIRADDLSLALYAYKLRRFTKGRVAQMAAMSAGPKILIDCQDVPREDSRQRLAQDAIRLGLARARMTPLDRGHIGRVYQRVKLMAGRREVQRTWGAGIRTLMAEPLYVLNGGRE